MESRTSLSQAHGLDNTAHNVGDAKCAVKGTGFDSVRLGPWPWLVAECRLWEDC